MEEAIRRKIRRRRDLNSAEIRFITLNDPVVRTKEAVAQLLEQFRNMFGIDIDISVPTMDSLLIDINGPGIDSRRNRRKRRRRHKLRRPPGRRKNRGPLIVLR